MAAATAGGLIAFWWAKSTLPPEQLEGSPQLPALYASMGAICGILAVRLITLFWSLFGDYFKRDKMDR